jgi:hypothetical protein
MNRLSTFLLATLSAIVAACAPDAALNSSSATSEPDYFHEIAGDYAVGPIYCEASIDEHVIIRDGSFVDRSGKTDPSQFRMDHVDAMLVTWSKGSQAGQASKVYLAFSNEPDGLVTLHVFYEMGFHEIEKAKASMGMKPSRAQSRSFDRRPLMYSQIKFDVEPSDYQVQQALMNDTSRRFILESCAKGQMPERLL